MGFLRGPQLFSLARKKAAQLGISQERGINLAELIHRVQRAEGNEPCFKQRGSCEQIDCCWRASCGAELGG